MRHRPKTSLLGLALVVGASCTLAVHDRAFERKLGYAQVEAAGAAVRAPVVVDDLVDDRSDPAWVARRRSATGPDSFLRSGNLSNSIARSRQSVPDFGCPRRLWKASTFMAINSAGAVTSTPAIRSL